MTSIDIAPNNKATAMIKHSAVSPDIFDIFDVADADLVGAINAGLEDDTQKAQLEQAIARSLETVASH
jgi:hypothetical protein